MKRCLQKGVRAPARIVRAAAALLALALLISCAGCARPQAQTAAPPATPPAPANAVAPPAAADGFEIYFVNVGKGDCALIRLPNGGWAIVDTGPPNAAAAVHGMMSLLGVKRLEAVFISHPHSDHVGNLDTVLSQAGCPAIYTTPADFGKPTAKMMDVAKSHQVPVKTLQPGATVEIGGARFTALNPLEKFKDENDNSLVLMMECGGVKALFPGDQLTEAESAVLKSGRSVVCDVLKAGHHGEIDASSEAFIQAASPRYCIITTSADPAEAPAPQVLERLNAVGAQAFVVGSTGTLCFSSAGMQVTPVTPAEPPAALVIRSVDAKAEYVEIENPTGRDVDLTGWSLRSTKGNQFYFFPAGYVLGSGQTVRIHSGRKREDVPAEGLFWTEEKIWHDKKTDAAALMDPYGRAVATK